VRHAESPELHSLRVEVPQSITYARPIPNSVACTILILPTQPRHLYDPHSICPPCLRALLAPRPDLEPDLDSYGGRLTQQAPLPAILGLILSLLLARRPVPVLHQETLVRTSALALGAPWALTLHLLRHMPALPVTGI